MICGPPPCTTTGRRPAYRRKATSSAKAALRASSTMALPPYLTTTSAPRKRSSQGNASTSVAALPAATRIAAASMSPRTLTGGSPADGKDGGKRPGTVRCCRSCAVGRVLVDVVMGQVVGPDGGRLGTGVRGRRGRATSRAVRSTRARSSPTPPERHTWTPFIVTSRAAGSKAARVVPTAARTRPQLGSLPKIAHLKRLLRATERATSSASSTLAAPTTSMAMSWEAPSASAMSCRARSEQTAVRASVELAPIDGHAGGARCQYDDGVVGRHARVGVDAVEGDGRCGAQRGVEVDRVDDGVGRQDDEHRRERRREHARALGHSGDRPALPGAHRDLVHGVGRLDRDGRGLVPFRGEGGGRGVDARRGSCPSAGARR